MLIDDRTHADLDHGATSPPPLGSFDDQDRVVTIGGMSKLYWGGLRLGWIRARSTLINRLLGRERGNAGTVEGGLEVLRQFLTQAGVASDQYAFFDGSGLSRQNLVTPQAVVQLLRYASSQAWGAAYKASFPVAGIDGSLAERLTAPRLQKRVMAKTGSLTGVRALSGYATTDSGQTVVFSIFSNNLNLPAKRVTDTIDHIVEAIVEDAPPIH